MKPKTYYFAKLAGLLYSLASFTFGNTWETIRWPVTCARLEMWLYDHSYQWRLCQIYWDSDPYEDAPSMEDSYYEANADAEHWAHYYSIHENDLRIVRDPHYACWRLECNCPKSENPGMPF